MVRRLSDDEVMDSVYKQLFGDLDSIEGKTLFDEDGDTEDAVGGTVKNAEPESKEAGGVSITIQPLMHAAQETSRKSAGDDEIEDEDDEDRLKGISGMSPLMARLHGGR